MQCEQGFSCRKTTRESYKSVGVNMKTLTTEYARTHLRDLLDEAIAGQPCVLTRYGKPVAVVVPASFLTLGHDIPTDANQSEPV